MIELYLHIKIYLDYFLGRLKDAELGKSMHLTFWVLNLKAVEVIPWYLYSLTTLFCIDLSAKHQGIWFNQTHVQGFIQPQTELHQGDQNSILNWVLKFDPLNQKIK